MFLMTETTDLCRYCMHTFLQLHIQARPQDLPEAQHFTKRSKDNSHIGIMRIQPVASQLCMKAWLLLTE